MNEFFNTIAEAFTLGPLWLKFSAATCLITGFATIVGIKVYSKAKEPEKSVISNNATVTSTNQTGGVTAQNVTTSTNQTGGITAQNVIVQNFYSGIENSRERKQALMKKYPLGFAIFALDEKNIVLPTAAVTFEKDVELKWTHAGVQSLTEEMIEIELPDMFYKPSQNRVSNCSFGFPRRVGHTAIIPMVRWRDSVGIVEVLADLGEYVVLVIGFAKQNDPYPGEQKLSDDHS